MALLFDLAVALCGFTLNGLEAGGNLALSILNFTAQLVGGRTGVARDGVDELVERLARLKATLLGSSSNVGDALGDVGKRSRRSAKVGSALGVLARRTHRRFGRVRSIRVTTIGDEMEQNGERASVTCSFKKSCPHLMLGSVTYAFPLTLLERAERLRPSRLSMRPLKFSLEEYWFLLLMRCSRMRSSSSSFFSD